MASTVEEQSSSSHVSPISLDEFITNHLSEKSEKHALATFWKADDKDRDFELGDGGNHLQKTIKEQYYARKEVRKNFDWQDTINNCLTDIEGREKWLLAKLGKDKSNDFKKGYLVAIIDKSKILVRNDLEEKIEKMKDDREKFKKDIKSKTFFYRAKKNSKENKKENSSRKDAIQAKEEQLKGIDARFNDIRINLTGLFKTQIAEVEKKEKDDKTKNAIAVLGKKVNVKSPRGGIFERLRSPRNKKPESDEAISKNSQDDANSSADVESNEITGATEDSSAGSADDSSENTEDKNQSVNEDSSEEKPTQVKDILYALGQGNAEKIEEINDGDFKGADADAVETVFEKFKCDKENDLENSYLFFDGNEDLQAATVELLYYLIKIQENETLRADKKQPAFAQKSGQYKILGLEQLIKDITTAETLSEISTSLTGVLKDRSEKSLLENRGPWGLFKYGSMFQVSGLRNPLDHKWVESTVEHKLVDLYNVAFAKDIDATPVFEFAEESAAQSSISA